MVSIRDCYATGAVNATNRSSAGGLVGHVRTEAVVERCFASSDVLVTDCGSVSGNTCLGGLIGYLNSGTVNDSYATGDVVGTNIAVPVVSILAVCWVISMRAVLKSTGPIRLAK